MRLRSKLFFLAILVVISFSPREAKPQMWCSPGYIYWIDHLPYCVSSGMTNECELCVVTQEEP